MLDTERAQKGTTETNQNKNFVSENEWQCTSSSVIQASSASFHSRGISIVNIIIHLSSPSLIMRIESFTIPDIDVGMIR